MHDPTHAFLKLRTPRPNHEFPFIPQPVNALSSSVSVPGTRGGVIAPVDLETPNARLEAVVQKINAFGFRLQTLCMRSSATGCGLSPLNIYICLMMAASGANGRTLEAFSRTLGFDGIRTAEVETLIADVAGLYRYCTTGQNAASICVQTGEAVWCHRHLQINPPWIRQIEEIFGGIIGAANAEIINAWVSERTKGLISNVVTKEVEEMPLTLVTCLYFKADWETPFDPLRTTSGWFHRFSGTVDRCNMMHRTGQMAYMEDDNGQMCLLPYNCAGFGNAQRPHWKAAVYLPKERGTGALLAILEHFSNNPASFSSLMSHLGSSSRRRTVQLSLPLTPPLSFPQRLKLGRWIWSGRKSRTKTAYQQPFWAEE